MRVTLAELRDLLLEEESDLDTASKSFSSSILTAMTAQKGPYTPPVGHGDNITSFTPSHDNSHWQNGSGHANWQSNWNRRPNSRGHARSWHHGNQGPWHAGGSRGQWNNGPYKSSHHAGQWSRRNNPGSWTFGHN